MEYQIFSVESHPNMYELSSTCLTSFRSTLNALCLVFLELTFDFDWFYTPFKGKNTTTLTRMFYVKRKQTETATEWKLCVIYIVNGFILILNFFNPKFGMKR